MKVTELLQICKVHNTGISICVLYRNIEYRFCELFSSRWSDIEEGGDGYTCIHIMVEYSVCLIVPNTIHGYRHRRPCPFERGSTEG